MRKITDFIINKRYFILLLFIVLTIISAIISTKVKINHDMAKYLPSTSETRIGMDIMEEEFSETSTLNLMFENLPDEEKLNIKSDLEKIDGVDSVDYESNEDYNKDNHTLYVITVDDKSDSQKATDVYNEITEKYKDYTIYTSGSISETNKTVLPFWIIALAVFSALVILIIMCESYVEPFLFLISILMAVVLNKGTNIIFQNVSNITNSIAAILQMALSMDYSIMLMNRYDQEKKVEKDKVKAMKNALYKAFQAISSSSVTTIVGLLALIFMSFKIGKDLGLVLAKGVFFSLVCIFFVLPSLILMFDKWIVKTKKKTPRMKLDKLGKFSYKARFVSVPIFIIIFITSFILKGNLGIDYTDSQIDEISKVFTENNQMAIIYKNEDEEKISQYLSKIEDEEKVDEVLGYGNTINEKLTYDKLNAKLNDLGSNVKVEDYLLKIVYYDYFNKDTQNKMTFNEFVNFIENDAYNNERASKKIDDKIKNDITKLKNFITISGMNEKRTSSDIASILEINKSKVDDIFVYYLSKNNNTQISINEFVNFMNKDVLPNEKYSVKVDKANREKLNTLSKFTDKNTIQKKMTSSQMAELFGIDNNTMSDLYKYYILVNDIDIKMTISEFSNFVINNVLTDSSYASSFDEDTVQNIKLLQTFSNINIINKQMNSKELSNLFGIDANTINQILLTKYSNENNISKYSVSEFICNVVAIKNDEKYKSYLAGADISSLEKLVIFASNQNNINTTKMNKEGLNKVFESFGAGFVDNAYLLIGLSDDALLSPKEFINKFLDSYNKIESGSLDESVFKLDNATLNNLNLLKLVINDSTSNNKIKYTAKQLSKILNINENQMYKLYSLIDYANNNTGNWTDSPNEFVNLILNNNDIKKSLDEENLKKLELLYNIMSSTINNKSYTYEELSNIVGIDSKSTKNIYTLYASSKNNTNTTPIEFVTFVLTHKNDGVLTNKITASTINELNLIKSVMNGVLNNKKYNAGELSSLLGINKENANLLYGLYTSKYVNTNPSLSLKEFVNFLLNDVVTNKDYSSNFDKDKVSKLNTVNGIMNASINNNEYTSDEIFGIISKLSDNVEKNTVEMLYTYYGSSRDYNNEWQMTVEEFVNFINQDILQDERFTDFIDDDMRNDIKDAKKEIDDARELLIGNKHSRIVLNTTFPIEGTETFEFIKNTKEMIGKEVSDFYIIGDSPMSYDISKTFDSELTLITIITMVAIFIVVAITFKSILIPTILVLTIQTAVYLTMGILSIVGENVYFIAILIVQSILMGATIDYAILYTSYYLEHRKTKDIKESVVASYNSSIHAILTSSSILIIVTLIIAIFTSAITAKICRTISEGTICSTLLILILLPAVLASCDKFIVKNKKIKK